MISAILSFFGKDKPGIIAGVTEILFKSGINLEDVSMTVLEDQLAMMMIVSGKKIQPGALEQSLNKHLRGCGIKLSMSCKIIRSKRSLLPKHQRQTAPYLIHVIGKDQTGIVYRFSQEMAEEKLNITDMNCKILGSGKKSLYALAMEIDVPAKKQNVRIKRLGQKLRQLAKKIGLEVTLKPLDVVSA